MKLNVRWDFNAVSYILMQLDYWATFHLKNKFLTEFGKLIEEKIDNKKQYDSFMKNVIKSSDKKQFEYTIGRVKEFSPNDPFLKLVKSEEEKFDIYELIKNSVFLFFIPNSLMEKIKGISIIGQMDMLFTSLYDQSTDVDNFVRFLYQIESEALKKK